MFLPERAAGAAPAASPSAPRLRGALVDLDGVVLDSLGVWGDIDRDYIRRHALANPETVRERLSRVVHLREAADYLHGECGVPDTPEEILEEFRRLLEDEYRHRLQVFPWVAERLRAMRGEGLRVALVSATSEPMARAALRRNGVEDCFDLFFCDADKRCADVLILAAAALGTVPAETLLVDDMESIRKIASAAGFRVADTLKF